MCFLGSLLRPMKSVAVFTNCFPIRRIPSASASNRRARVLGQEAKQFSQAMPRQGAGLHTQSKSVSYIRKRRAIVETLRPSRQQEGANHLLSSSDKSTSGSTSMHCSRSRDFKCPALWRITRAQRPRFIVLVSETFGSPAPMTSELKFTCSRFARAC